MAFLEGRDDKDQVIKALADADPEGPRPDPSEEDEGDVEWGPIRLGALPPAEPFPLDVLPIAARDLAGAAARSIGCPIDFPAVATLAAASGAIGRSASLLVKPGYFASASLYLALVGGPSSGKSPSLGAGLGPLKGIGEALHGEWAKALAAWKEAPEDDRGEKPIMRRVLTTDPTTEALGPILARNPRGATITPDEMTKWIMSMDQYKGGKGGDKPFYLSAWGSESITIDRAKHADEPIIVNHPFLTVAGGMTPDMLATLQDRKGDDGFTARILFTYPPRCPRPYSEDGIADAATDAWRDLVGSLWARPMRDMDGKPSPHVVKMDPEARREWGRWCRAHRVEQEADDFPSNLEGPWGKLEAYAARLALILHLMDLASDPTAPRGAEPPEMPRKIILDAARLVAYFKSHARRVHASMGGKAGAGDEDVRALLGWIGRNELAEFSTRDIGKNFDRFKDDPAALADATDWMVAKNLVRLRPEAKNGKPGRKPSPTFEVNPSLLNSPRFRQFRRNSRSAPSSDGNDGNAVVGEDQQ